MPDANLNTGQLANANIIIRVGKNRGMSTQDIVTALTVALTESGLQNYANRNVPESMNLAHDAVGSDHMSVGVFQQQVGIWGTAAELMDVTTAANKFYDKLAAVPQRRTMTIPQAAQTVQQSAFSDGSNYAAQVARAETVYTGKTGNSTGNITTGTSKPAGPNPLTWISNSGNWARIGLTILGGLLVIIALYKLLDTVPAVHNAIQSGKKAVMTAAEAAVIA